MYVCVMRTQAVENPQLTHQLCVIVTTESMRAESSANYKTKCRQYRTGERTPRKRADFSPQDNQLPIDTLPLSCSSLPKTSKVEVKKQPPIRRRSRWNWDGLSGQEEAAVGTWTTYAIWEAHPEYPVRSAKPMADPAGLQMELLSRPIRYQILTGGTLDRWRGQTDSWSAKKNKLEKDTGYKQEITKEVKSKEHLPNTLGVKFLFRVW